MFLHSRLHEPLNCSQSDAHCPEGAAALPVRQGSCSTHISSCSHEHQTHTRQILGFSQSWWVTPATELSLVNPERIYRPSFPYSSASTVCPSLSAWADLCILLQLHGRLPETFLPWYSCTCPFLYILAEWNEHLNTLRLNYQTSNALETKKKLISCRHPPLKRKQIWYLFHCLTCFTIISCNKLILKSHRLKDRM